jgi:hypothetical protein
MRKSHPARMILSAALARKGFQRDCQIALPISVAQTDELFSHQGPETLA